MLNQAECLLAYLKDRYEHATDIITSNALSEKACEGKFPDILNHTFKIDPKKEKKEKVNKK